MKRAYLLKHALVLGLFGALTACGGGGTGADGEQQQQPEGEDGPSCFSNRDYFAKKVWTPVLEQRCFSCHNTSGQAKYTSLVLQPSSQTGHIDANLESFTRAARYEAEGSSVLLQKPLGGLEHQGGKVLDEDSPEYNALVEMLQRLDNPVECEDTLTVDSHFAGVELLTPEQTLRKVTLNLGGRLPTPEEEALVAEQGIDGIDQVIENLASEDVFYERIEEMFNDMFLTDRYVGRSNAVGLLDTDIFPEARWYEDREENDLSDEDPAEVEAARQYANDSVAREPLKLISYIIRNDRPFTEILTADYTIVNPFSARVYGIEDIQWEDPLDPNEWREGRIPGMPHAGVLTSPMFLNRFPTTATNRNRHRSRMVYKFFLATDVMALAERPVDPTSIEDFNPTMYNPQCTSCHAVIDPVAGAFQNFDERGRYMPPENGWFEDMRPPGFGEQTIKFEDRTSSLPWLAEKFANDQRFATATIHNLYRGLTGHDLIVPMGDDETVYSNLQRGQEVQQLFFDELGTAFMEDGYNVKTVIKGLVKSPYFRAKNLPGDMSEEQRIQYSEMGTGRLLTPEMLHRKIIAVTGYPWAYTYDRNRAYLHSTREYKILYGGIDSDGVVERITEPNGIMANIQWRMANEMACLATAHDFVKPPEERLLFKHVEPTFVPEDENGFAIEGATRSIKQNIQHLYWHVLGERVALDDPELERAYNLWYDTWKEGKQLLEADEISQDLQSRCRAERDFWTGEDYPEEVRIRRDGDYTIRAWQAVMTYMLSDYQFLYE